MIHQDWSQVSFNSKKKKNNYSKINTSKREPLQKKFNGGKNSQIQTVNANKIEKEFEEDKFELKTISYNTKVQIQKGREEKKFTQKQLGQKCNLPENIIRDYEQGKGILKQNDLLKISKALGITIKK